MSDDKDKAIAAVLKEFEQLMLDTFDKLKATPSMDKKQLAHTTGTIGKYFLKQSIAIRDGVDPIKLKHNDFVMVPRDMVIALEQMADGFNSAAERHKKGAH